MSEKTSLKKVRNGVKNGVCFACEASNLEELFSGAAHSKHWDHPLGWSRGWHLSGSYCTMCCHGNNLTNCWCEGWLSQTWSPRPGCQATAGKAFRALTGLFFPPWFYCSLLRPTAMLGFMKDRQECGTFTAHLKKPAQICVGRLKHPWYEAWSLAWLWC